jgi:hypothetical protein
LAVGQVFAELQDDDEGQAPRGKAGLTTRGEERNKVLILEDRTERVTQRQIRIAFGKGGMGHTGGFFRHRFEGMRA